MVEYIVVAIVLALIVAVWVALCVESEGSILKGVTFAILLPVVFVAAISGVLYILYSFITVIQRLT